MPGVSRVGIDTFGTGIIQQKLQNTVTLEGYEIAVIGANITNHGGGAHASAKISSGSETFTISGLKVCREGDLATCLHTATGSPKMSSG